MDDRDIPGKQVGFREEMKKRGRILTLKSPYNRSDNTHVACLISQVSTKMVKNKERKKYRAMR